MCMRLSRSVMALCFGITASAVVATGVARATDYFGMDLRGAEFASQPLGPAATFQVAAPSPAAAPSVAPRAGAGQTAAAPARKVHVAQIHRAPRARRSPLRAYASLTHARPCAPGGVCVWDGKRKLWRAP